MSAEDTMISINGLTKDFGAFRAVDNISFDVKKGEVLGFLGPNGAGKSTTMKMVTGYLPISAGKASVCGFDVQAHPLESKAKIGYLPEGAPLYGDMTTTGFLNFIAEIRGLVGDAKKTQVAFAIDKLQLQSVMNQPIDTLSKGFKRRVGFAQAVLHDPEVLILDEPTDGLDPNQKHQVRELISEMATEKAIVISTHILEEVEAVCTRAVIIAAGKIVFDDTPAQLKAQSSSGSLDDVFRQLTLVN
jgi:ABC-2 type transport system ATP-binding protein